MLDLLFDIEIREIVMQDGDFATTTNPSVQNGGILRDMRAANILSPMSGIGLEEVIGADMSKLAYEMNRWQQMAKDDGATIAKWTAVLGSGNVADIQQEVSYE